MNASECIAALKSEIPGFMVLSSVTFDNQKGFVFGCRIWSQDAEANTTLLQMYVDQFVDDPAARITDTAEKTYRIRYGDSVYEWNAPVTDTIAAMASRRRYRLNGNYITVPNDQLLVFRLWVNLSTGPYTSTQCETQKLFSVERRSTLTVPSLTLDSTSTLTISRKTSTATHTIRYMASGASAWTEIVANTSETHVSWTPPMELANSSPGSTSVSVTIRLLTYTDSGWGYYDYDVNIAIPASVKPTAAITVEDGNGYAATFGQYLHSKSTYAVNITATPAYSSSIVSYSTVISGKTINGNAFSATYSGSSFVTDVLELVGSVSIVTTVTDARGRTGTAAGQFTAVEYIPPLISALSIHRCNTDGVENDQGEYVSFTFSGTVQALSNINTAQYWYRFKSSVDSSYTSVALSGLANQYSVTNHTVIIPADSSYTYDIIVNVQDKVMTTEMSAQASTAATILNLHNSGTGLAIGKVAEQSNLFDVGLPTRFRSEVIFDQPIDAGGVELGETSTTAYRGDRGKTAYDHSLANGNPHSTTKVDIGLGNVNNTSDTNKPISTAMQTALNGKLPLTGGTVTGPIQCNNINGTDGANIVETFSVNGVRHVQLGTSSTYAYIPCSGGRIDVGSYSIQFETASGYTILGSSDETYCQLGKSTGRWRSLYAVNGTIQTSDKRRKQDVSYDLDKIKQVMSRVKPLSYRYNDIENDKTRYGFFAQDLELELNNNGLDAADIAGLTIDEIEPTEMIPDGKLYGISYEQFIPIAIAMIQDLQIEVARIKSEIASMKG